VLVVLSPLFRYSDWRDAWILRVIGEAHGPVLRRAKPADEAEVRVSDRLSRVPLLGGSAVVMMLAATVILAAAALGFAVARSANGGGTASALDGHASTRSLRLSFPAAWRRQMSPVPSQLGLDDAIALAPSRPHGEMLVIGRTVTPDAQLLPPALLASLPSAPTPQTVTLGRATFYRYLNLSPRGEQDTASVYAMSTTSGTVLGVCIAHEEQTSFISSCERALGTLELTSARALPPGPSPSYASALDLAIRRLNTVRASVGSQLLTAPAAKTQATAAYALAAAHAHAAAALSHLNAGPATAANSAVVTALKLTGAAYQGLGSAAARSDSRGYGAASASLRRATSALTAAYSRLGAFGYSVS
jgi:hypothetical protein